MISFGGFYTQSYFGLHFIHQYTLHFMAIWVQKRKFEGHFK
jgi:hypothetical protein